MKTLYIGVQKGGVGKSTNACQLALYARNLGYRVLVIDFDDQGKPLSSSSAMVMLYRLPKR